VGYEAVEDVLGGPKQSRTLLLAGKPPKGDTQTKSIQNQFILNRRPIKLEM
jgi:hypothetical protein